LQENNILEVYRFIHGEKSVTLNCSMALDRWEDYESIVRREGGLKIKTLEGEMLASFGDYVIKGVSNEYYPCKPDIFEKTYEPAE
jgi:hypothetical protein